MEEKSCCGGAGSWYTRVSRLAAAIAIIRITPSGVGARQFAESLAHRLRQQDESWRSRAQGLEEDLLHLRQELLLTQALVKTRSDAGPGHGQEISDLPSQDDLQQMKGDSGCETEHTNCSQTQLGPTQGLCFPPTPLNAENLPLQHRKWHREHRLGKHMRFLQCLSGLRRGFEASLCRDGDVLWDSVVQLLDSAVDVFRQACVGQPLHHPDQLLQATRVVAQTLSRGGTRHGCSVRHLSRVEDLMKEMIDLLLTNQQLNAGSVQAMLSECVQALGGSDVMRTPLVQHLMAQILQLAQQLWHNCESIRVELHYQVDWIRYQNSFYVFWLLEHLAQDGPSAVKPELVEQLESRALPLADEFPLFSLYMWRIGGLFRAGHT